MLPTPQLLGRDAACHDLTAHYLLSGLLGAFVWDILSNLSNDYRLLFRYRLSLPTITYFISRLSMLSYILLNTVLETSTTNLVNIWAARGPGGGLRGAISSLSTIVFSSTSLLFILRVRAIFNNNRRITTAFFSLWGFGLLASLAAQILACPQRPRRSGTVGLYDSYAGVAPTAMSLIDTCVFIAISWRLIASQGDGILEHKHRLSKRLRGGYLPAFSRAILRDGQVYYLVSVTCNLTLAILTFIPASLNSNRVVFTVGSCTVTNVLACQVYRKTKFGHFREDTISSTWIASQLRHVDLPDSDTPRSAIQFESPISETRNNGEGKATLFRDIEECRAN